MAAILFTDVVGFSLLSNPIQRQVAQGLNEECSKHLLPAFRHQRMHPTNTTFVAAMPTGDGVVICLRETPDIDNPGLFLLELAFKLQDWGRRLGERLDPALDIKLRTGLHSGDLLSIEDVNQQRNFCGHDINMAQRIMDCGDADHILCSVDAYNNYFRQLPARCSAVAFTSPDSFYKIKHGESIRIYNITSVTQGELSYGNPVPPPVHWKYRILPFVRRGFIHEFESSRHLVVVGVTSEQFAHALRETLMSNNEDGCPLKSMTTLDVYYPLDAIFDYMPREQAPIGNPAAVPGYTNRSLETLKKEKEESIETLRSVQLASGNRLTINVGTYSVSPIAAIVAGDYQDRESGVIQITHYVWGRASGTSPTMVLRWGELPEAYEIYADYLRFLAENSEVETL